MLRKIAGVNISYALPSIDDIKLAVFDMDGTLLGPDHAVHPENIDAIHRLNNSGVHVLLASGRNHDNLSQWYEKLHLVGPVVSGNGALVRDFASQATILESALDPTTAYTVLNIGRQINITQVVDHTDGTAVVESKTFWGDLVGERCGRPLLLVESLDSICLDGPRKILWVADGPLIAQWEIALRTLLKGKANITVSGEEYLEILPFETHKGKGVIAAASHLGYLAEHTLSAGDSDNDAEMLGWSRYGMAMAHATEKAKNMARFTLPDGDPETAIAKMIHSLYK